MYIQKKIHKKYMKRNAKETIKEGKEKLGDPTTKIYSEANQSHRGDKNLSH